MKTNYLGKIMLLGVIGIFAVIAFIGLKIWLNYLPPFEAHYDLPVKSKYSMVVEQGVHTYTGEIETAHRMVVAAQNLGWDVELVISLDDKATVDKVNALNPDFVLSMVPAVSRTTKLALPNYVILSLGTDYYFRNNWYNLTPTIRGSQADFINNIFVFDGILFSDTNLSRFAKWFKDHKHPFYGITYYPYAPIQNDVNFAVSRYEHPRIMFSGDNWDSKRKKKYPPLYQKLAEKGYIDFYGPAKSWKMVGDAYKGFIPADGKAFLSKMQTYAVALVLHGTRHLSGGVSSARIFEAAAAGNVIISDRNSFVVNNFGDSVLYIDVDVSNDEIFKQIDQRMQWIAENPQKAKAMAESAHKIFLERFTLEQMLLRLAHMHESVIHDKVAQ